jgi:hypothetical protein
MFLKRTAMQDNIVKKMKINVEDIENGEAEGEVTNINLM